MLKVIDSCRKLNYFRCFSFNYALQSNEDEKENKPKSKRKVSETVELVKLVDQNDKILGLKSKKDAETLAKKLNLTMERIHDSNLGKVYPVYKLMSSSDLLKVESKKTTAKTLKKLPLNGRISDHDLKVKVQIVRKWLAKNCEVHIAVTGNQENDPSMKNIFNTIQEEFKEECRIIDIRKKENSLKFIVLPPKQKPPASGEKNEETSRT